MKMLFALSYALLWALIVMEAAVLQEILRRTVWYKRLYTDSRRRTERQQLSPGTLAPEFTARILGKSGTLSRSDLKGHATILLFVSSAEASSPLYEKLSAGIYALWLKAEGNLYLVCSGDEVACRQIALDHCGEGFRQGHVPVILDEQARIARSFLISGTPLAVMLDEDTRIGRYGNPVSSVGGI